VRVIAGACRGRRLHAPAGSATRPTADRVREAVFDVVGSLADFEGMSVLDLFAGSGALGIEALSRGAARVTFVERDRRALAALHANLTSLGLEDRALVVHAEALRWLSGPTARRTGRARGPYHLALCDPPYAFDAWEELLAHLDASLAVLESSRPLAVPDRWQVVRSKRYGSTLVTVVSPAPGVLHASLPSEAGTPRQEKGSS
jgi:16S rRNA (guanine966-N2)-methyltransferase